MHTTKENAPDAGQGVEGLIPEGSNLMNQSVALSTDNTKVDREAKTLPFPRRRPHTPEEVAFARDEGLSDLPVRYVLLSKPRGANFATPDGGHFRPAGRLNVRRCRDGVRRFVAYLHPDSIRHDFRHLDHAIANATCGGMEGWRRHTFKGDDDGWVFGYTSYQIDGLKNAIPAEIIITETSDSPGLVGYGTEWGIPCTEPRCMNTHHENLDESHTLETLTRKVGDYFEYEIEIVKYAGKTDAKWHINIDGGTELSEATPEMIASFTNDLNWMSIECATANAKESAA